MIKKEIFGLSVQLEGIQRPCATKSRVRLPLVSFALRPAALHPSNFWQFIMKRKVDEFVPLWRKGKGRDTCATTLLSFDLEQSYLLLMI